MQCPLARHADRAREGAQIDLGDGHEVEFVMAPNLHWPDTMFSFDHKTGAPLGAMPLAACGA